MNKLALAAAALALGAVAAPAAAQNCVGRPDFDACMAGHLNQMQSANNAAMQRTWQNYLRQFGPWLRQQYARQRPNMSFEQFAYWNMMTANGTNIQGGIDAQNRQFAGNQAANATRQEGYSSYRQGMYANSARTDAVAENFDNQVYRGNSYQVNPNTGQGQWMPYQSVPYNQPFNQGGNTYMSTQNGYYMWNGSGWQAMPGR